MYAHLVVFVFCLFLITVRGDYGPCRYEENHCSCKYGKESQGICWDKIAASPGFCKRRYCKAGWTCGCGGRTHLCKLGKKTVSVVAKSEDKNKQKADCISKDISLVRSTELKLGRFTIYFSKAGMAANQCTIMSWWLDGNPIGVHEKVVDMKSVNVDDVLKARQEHSLLEIREDSLLAFRIRNGSYYCFKHFAKVVANGVEKNTGSSGVTVHYSRQYTKDWYKPSYKLTADRMGKSEEDGFSKFLPLRKTMLTSKTEILPENDYWAPVDAKNKDTRLANWYYRIQLTKKEIIL